MDALVTDSRARNFVKYCIAVRSCTEGLILFILKQCEEQFTRNVQYIKSVNGKEHAEQCNALHERIQSKHVHKQPTWNNADWSVPFNRSWQHMKCYITDSGYLETTSPQEAGLKALVQICYNHLDLQNSFGQQVTNLFKIEQTHDTIFKSESWLITDAALGTYVLDIQHVLTHVHQNLNSDVNAQLNIMQKLISDEIPVTVIDEIYARQHAVSTLNRFLISLDGTISNPQISDEIRTKKAELLVVKDIHARKRDELIRDADAKLDLLKQIVQTKENELLKIKAVIANQIPHNPIGNCVRANVDLQANTSHQTYATFLQEKIYDNSIETVCKQEQTENSIKIVGEGVLALSYNLSKVAEALGVQGLHLGELRMTANVLGTDNNDVLNRDIVNAGSERQNGVHLADRHGSQLQRSLQPVCEHLDNDGSSITRINYECVAFYIRCSTLHELNTLCEDFLTDKIQHLFQPLQDYLRTLPGCSNAYIVVNITERDFLKCIDPILRNVNHTLDLKSPVHSHISSKRVTPVASSSKHATEICTEKSETLAKEIQNNGANSLDTHHNKRTLNLYYYHCLQAICPWALGDTYERASEVSTKVHQLRTLARICFGTFLDRTERPARQHVNHI
ncbi:uncharacterized protein LOC127839180 isoform X2 [Dreissena polymorpha]|uniref:uncharacterized protein LOC127839180 isoform X2 n=1 Tax=Dreissena polymorpha TaxID=45954 RepID=UPI0022649472|nr:uncharacterized protein LOC127839180 isoform X2 [Dreissena polymorpha]